MVTQAPTKKKITLSYGLFGSVLLGTLVLGMLSGGLLSGAVLSLLGNSSSQGRQASTAFDRAWMGMTYMPITPAIAASAQLSATTGALVVAVTPNSPADKAGLREDDVVTAIDQQAIDESTSPASLMSNKRAGDHVLLTIQRDGASQTIDVVLGRLPRSVMAPDNHGILEPLRRALARIVDGH